MKITDIQLFEIEPRWLFVRIRTDAGVTGWGEPIVEGRAATTAKAVEELSEQLIGQDPHRIEDLFQAMHRSNFYRGGPILMSAISGLEQALWDIKGKDLGVPVYTLLGGRVRDRMRLYAHVGGDTPETMARAVKDAVHQGFTAVKLSVTHGATDYVEDLHTLDTAVSLMEAARQAGGKDLRIAIDFHGRVHRSVARVLAHELEQFSPYFYEEIVLPEHNDILRSVVAGCNVPIATGERNFSRWQFKDILKDGLVDIVQPDVSHCGGIFEMRKIAAMAEAYDVALAPHCPLGPLTFASSLQVDFCTPNALVQEQVFTLPGYNTAVAQDQPPQMIDGHVTCPTLPGLGIEINEDVIIGASKPAMPWRAPRLRRTDGSVAEW